MKPKYYHALFTVSLIFLLPLMNCSQNYSPEINSAIKAAKWLEGVGFKTDHGFAWPADPKDSTSVITNFYSGSSGVVLFFLELYHSTNQTKYFDRFSWNH